VPPSELTLQPATQQVVAEVLLDIATAATAIAGKPGDAILAGIRYGTDQIRYFSIESTKLVIKTAPLTSTIGGRQVINTLIFERVD
jgi:hypothetical protein